MSLWDKLRNRFVGCGRDGVVRHVNWWDNRPSWFSRFLNRRLGLPPEAHFRFYSVFGPKELVYRPARGAKVFFSGENLHRFYREYGDYCLDEVDLALGFDDLPNPRYLRFPLWITRIFPPEATEEAIGEEIRRMNRPRPPRERFFALIAGHDKWNTRTPLHDALSARYPVDCAGCWRRNTRELQARFGDDKRRFLEQYAFNICPENTDTPLYVTEKPFEAIQAGCTPVYFGSGNRPEPEVLNREALVLWDPGSPGEALETIRRAVEDPAFGEELRSRPFFLPRAAEVVAEKFAALEALLRRCVP